MKKALLKIYQILKTITYYLFAKISNGLLFILVGVASLLCGCIFEIPLAIALGAAIAVSGLVFSFYRENKYLGATKEIKNLKKEQHKLKESIRLLNGRVDLLEMDLVAAQKEIKKLRNMKMVEYYNDGKSQYFVAGKSGPDFSE